MNKMTDTLVSNENLHNRRLAATPRGIGVMANFFIDKALNSEVWDIEGRRFIDFGGGIAVLNTGHRHPKSRWLQFKTNWHVLPIPVTKSCPMKVT
jgi:4-aminobutyrate aminotransferase